MMTTSHHKTKAYLRRASSLMRAEADDACRIMSYDIVSCAISLLAAAALLLLRREHHVAI